MYVGHVALGMTITSVGLGFQRDKSTVLHACRKVEDMRDDPAFDFVVGRMERLARIMARTSPVMKGN